jgi:hypothetical protein
MPICEEPTNGRGIVEFSGLLALELGDPILNEIHDDISVIWARGIHGCFLHLEKFMGGLAGIIGESENSV